MGWAETELNTINLGDQRLNKRAAVILNSLFDKSELSIPAACNGWGETIAAYRFFDNSKTTPEKILSPHVESTRTRAREYQDILCIEDTSEMDFSSKPETQGIGPLSYEKQLGFHVHPTLVTTPSRIPLGVINSYNWARDKDSFGKAKERANLPIEEKESIRWINGYRVVAQFAQDLPEKTVTYVADREADIYELFLEREKLLRKNENAPELLIRAQHNRALNDGGKIKERFNKAEVLGEIQFSIPPGRGRKARMVTQEVKVVRVELKAPYRKDRTLERLKITAIYAYEKEAPEGEKAIKWILLTSTNVKTFEECCTIITNYLARWDIEIFFKVLKSGCNVEKLQLENFERLQNSITLFMIVAWRIMFLIKLGRECPDLPCTVLFEKEEWEAAYIVYKKKRPPENPPNLNDMIKMVASFGGYLCRKSDGPPGPKVLWVGLQRVKDFALALSSQAKGSGDEEANST
jgi:hypothetical protein